jgi:hypothetical protein
MTRSAKKAKSPDAKKLLRALRRAAADAYKSEIIETEMESLTIGKGGDFNSREEWIQHRLDTWLRGRRAI